jgi:hypothetical protein
MKKNAVAPPRAKWGQENYSQTLSREKERLEPSQKACMKEAFS